MSSTLETDVSSTREADVSSTRETDVSSTRETDVSSTLETDVSSTREADVSSTREAGVARTLRVCSSGADLFDFRSMRRVLALLLVSAAALGAQDTTRADTAVLAPTIVTVTRIPVELSRAPFAIGVTTRDEIQRGKLGLGLDEALAGIAGVQVDNRFNYALGERIVIRGMGARAQFGVRGVRVLLDGIPMTLADGQTTLNNVDVAGVARAEVIRGPASALHGNAAGGVIQLFTDAPAHITDAPFGGEVRTSAGEHGMRRYQAALAARGAATSYSLALSRLSFDGYRQWNNARNDHATLRMVHEDDGGRRSVAATANVVDYDGQNPGSMSEAMLAANRDSAFANNTRFQTGERGRQGQLGATVRQLVGTSGELEFSAHGVLRSIDNPIPQRIVVIDRAAGGTRAALTLTPTVAERAVRFSVGTELQVQHDDRRNFVNNDGARGADTLSQLERVTNSAVFVQTSLDLVPRLRLSLGGRLDRVEFSAEDRLVGAGNPDDSGERTMSAASPSVGLTWSPLGRLDVYANYATSFETPTTSELANQESGAGGLNPTLEPQRTRSAEFGVNGRLLAYGVAGSYQLALYDARITDALIPFEVASVPGRQYFRNAGSTRHRGAEVGTSLAFPAGLSLRASYTHVDARFVRYATESDTFDMKRVPGIAANRADATLSYQPSRLFVDLETRISSTIPVNDANTDRSPGYVIHGLRIGVNDVPAGTATVTPHFGVMNVFDRDYNTSVVVNAFGGRFYEPGPGRSFYAGLRVRF